MKTKLDVILSFTANGLFDTAKDLIDSLSNNISGTNEKAYNHALYMANIIYNMRDWTQFSVKTMLDIATRLYGFAHGCAYSEIDVFDNESYDYIEDLYELVKNNCLPIIESK